MVLIALVISLTSTYIVTVYVGNVGNNANVQKEVKTYYIQQPSSSTGYISIDVLPKKESDNALQK